MAAAHWTPEYAQQVKAAFYEFLNHVEIKSKEAEESWIILGHNLYGAQTTVIDAIFDGLGRDVHDFKVLKSRQLGVSTIIRALMLFWLGMFVMNGALVFDSSTHLDEGRQELIDMLERLPAKFKFPRKARDNRYSLSLHNKSRVNLVAAGVKETKGSGALGAGSAVAMTHRSELSNYGNTKGLESFRHSQARKNPNRLFIDESTARGYNIWHDIWEEAKLDPHSICIFCGWWSHPDQKIDFDDPDYDRFGTYPCTKTEIQKIMEVKKLYGHDITPQQLAWIRREMNPSAEMSGDADADFDGTAERKQEQPWTEDDAWQQSGAVFFDPEKLKNQYDKNVSRKYRSYSYYAGVEFTDFRVGPAPNAKSVQLKVWEEPVEGSVYVIAADPAYGHSEKSDRSCAQVLRCYADGVDQVAEYAWPLIDTRQFAWVVASLEGWYGGETSIVYRILEINGPGEAVFNELQGLRKQIQFGYFGNDLKERGLENIQRNVRNYIYTRSDSMHPGHSYQFKTQNQLKVAVLNRLKDFTNNGLLRIRSADTVEEMRTVTQEGDSIEAQGNAKDDRVISLALGLRCWEERARIPMMRAKRTRDKEAASRRLTILDQVTLYNQSQFESFLAGKSLARRRAAIASRREKWRHG